MKDTKKQSGVLHVLRTNTMKYIKRLLVGFGIKRWTTSKATGSLPYEILFKDEVIESNTYRNFPIYVTETITRRVTYCYYWKETCNDQQQKTKESVSTSSGITSRLAQCISAQKN